MTLTSKFEQALVYSTVVHAAQSRKGTAIPYIAHLLAVTSIVLEHGGTETEAIAALLHDAVEDAGGRGRLENISARFGNDVAEIVEACSDAETQPKPPWRERKVAYINRISKKSAAARLVSAADKLHNARAILADYRVLGEDLWVRFAGKKDGTLWYYRSLVTAFRAAGDSPLIQELDRVVTQLEHLADGRGESL